MECQVSKIIFHSGATFRAPGTWHLEDPLTAQTVISCRVIFPTPYAFDVTVTDLVAGEFLIYASSTDTLLWPKGTFNVEITRTDPDFFPNGDDLVSVAERFSIEVR